MANEPLLSAPAKNTEVSEANPAKASFGDTLNNLREKFAFNKHYKTAFKELGLDAESANCYAALSRMLETGKAREITLGTGARIGFKPGNAASADEEHRNYVGGDLRCSTFSIEVSTDNSSLTLKVPSIRSKSSQAVIGNVSLQHPSFGDYYLNANKLNALSETNGGLFLGQEAVQAIAINLPRALKDLEAGADDRMEISHLQPERGAVRSNMNFSLSSEEFIRNFVKPHASGYEFVEIYNLDLPCRLLWKLTEQSTSKAAQDFSQEIKDAWDMLNDARARMNKMTLGKLPRVEEGKDMFMEELAKFNNGLSKVYAALAERLPHSSSLYEVSGINRFLALLHSLQSP